MMDTNLFALTVHMLNPIVIIHSIQKENPLISNDKKGA